MAAPNDIAESAMMTSAPEADAASKAGTKPDRLFNHNYLLLWQGQAVSHLGNQAFMIALTFWIKHNTGSATLMGLMGMTSGLAAILTGPLGGALADRWSRRRIILACDFFSGFSLLMLAGLVLLLPSATTLITMAIFAVAVSLSCVSSFFSPAISAAIPDLVPKQRLAQANSIGQITVQMAIFIGQGIGGTLYRVLGAPILFLLDGLSFLYAAISTTFVSIPQKRAAAENRKAGWGNFLQDVRAGWNYVRLRHGLRELVMVYTLLNFFTIPIISLLPFYVEDVMQLKPDWYSWLIAAYGAGSMIGFLIAGLLRAAGDRRMHLIVLGMAGEAVCYCLLGLTRQGEMALLLAVLTGIVSGMVHINLTTLLQQITPDQLRGRVFGLVGTIVGCLAPLAMAFAGIVADQTNKDIAAIYVMCGLSLLVIALVAGMDKKFRAFLSWKPVATDEQEADD
jgi:MFS family permease